MYRSALYGLAGIGQIPRPHLGRDKFVYHGGTDGPQRAIELSPKAQEAAKRALFTGKLSGPHCRYLSVMLTYWHSISHTQTQAGNWDCPELLVHL